MNPSFLLLAAVFAICLAGIRLFIHWSRRRQILDIPNERSSHSRPVPVGAGLVIAFVVLTSIATFKMLQRRPEDPSEFQQLAAYFLCSAILIAVSWYDDVREVPIPVKFVIHSAAAVLFILASASWIASFGDLWWLGWICSFVWLVGLTNAYNFMDGIDGMAGIQGVTAGIGWGVLGLVSGHELVSFAGYSIAAASLAFLWFNWQPAKVFMGDSGSAFLGFSFAAFPLFIGISGSRESSIAFSPWLILFMATALVWPFVADFSLTFFRGLVGVKRFWEPHRRHLYQAMVINGWEHSTVSVIYGLCGTACAAVVVISVIWSAGIYILAGVLPAVTLLLIALASPSGSGKGSGI